MAKILRFYCGLRDNRGGSVEPEVYRAVLDAYFPAYTQTWAQGRWEGIDERSIVFEVALLDDEAKGDYSRLCERLAEAGRQDAVMLAVAEADVLFFGALGALPPISDMHHAAWLRRNNLL